MNNDIVGWFSTENGTHIPIKKGQTKNEAIKEKFNNGDDLRKKEKAISDTMYSEWKNAANNELKSLVSVGKGEIEYDAYTEQLGKFIDVDGKLNKIASQNYSKNFSFNDNTKKSTHMLPDGSMITIQGHHGISENAGNGGVSVVRNHLFKELDRKNFEDYESAYQYANEVIDEIEKR